MVIRLTLYFKKGQCIELSPQQGAEAWPEPVLWHGYGALATDTIKRLLSCSQVLASSSRKRELSVYDRCTRVYDSAEARCAHTMSPTSPYRTHGRAVATSNILMTCWHCNVLLDWPVSWRKDVLSVSAMKEGFIIDLCREASWSYSLLTSVAWRHQKTNCQSVNQCKFLKVSSVYILLTLQGNVIWHFNGSIVLFFLTLLLASIP